MTTMVTGIGVSQALPNIAAPASSNATGGFSEALKGALDKVNELSGQADQQVGNVLQGGKADMSSVMISVEKADIAFQLALQVRNKIVTAYQDVEKMQF